MARHACQRGGVASDARLPIGFPAAVSGKKIPRNPLAFKASQQLGPIIPSKQTFVSAVCTSAIVPIADIRRQPNGSPAGFSSYFGRLELRGVRTEVCQTPQRKSEGRCRISIPRLKMVLSIGDLKGDPPCFRLLATCS